jgi:predicted lipoprotein
MGRVTKAQLERKVEELEKQVAELSAQQKRNTRVITIAYNLDGQVLSAARSGNASVVELQAMKDALNRILYQTDILLLGAVEREATLKVRREKRKDTEEKAEDSAE